MAYCKSCGAYIPDGHTTCLACGYDETAPKQTTAEQPKSQGQAAASATAQEPKRSTGSGKEKYKQVDSEFLRKQLEEQRRRQQANSKKWAETEYAQRQRVKEEQQRNFTNTSGRSRSEAFRGTGSDYYRTVRSTMQQDDIGKVMAGLSYFSILFVLPYIFRKDDDFAMYHAKQGRNLFIAGIIGDIVGGLLGLGWLVGLARILLALIGISNVIKGLKKPLPFIGDLFK